MADEDAELKLLRALPGKASEDMGGILNGALPEDFVYLPNGPEGRGLYYRGPLPRTEAMHEALVHLMQGALAD